MAQIRITGVTANGQAPTLDETRLDAMAEALACPRQTLLVELIPATEKKMCCEGRDCPGVEVLCYERPGADREKVAQLLGDWLAEFGFPCSDIWFTPLNPRLHDEVI